MKKNLTKILLFVFLGLVVLTCFAVLVVDQLCLFLPEKSTDNGVIVRTVESELCGKYNGTWVEVGKECEGISREICESNGGYFNECASACRNNKESTICTMQCVLVCEYAEINNKADLIRPSYPRPNQIITNRDLSINGSARGTWFFEASFPIQITDSKGNVLQESFASATSDWMTENFVPFNCQMTLNSNIKGQVNLVLKKDNPSGLPQFDDQLIIPIEVK